ncbi:MAG: ribonuclease T2 [Fimbriimonadaceae bacterium]|nr:ribonuclease T2 [Alphaproteobacteria bacterium]
MKQVFLGALAIVAVLTMSAAARDERRADFDYWALTLSWSPTYCASDAGRNNHQQCSPGRRFAFVVHGLWPQYEQGWPAHCGGNGYVSDRLIDAMRDVMPSKGLIIHQWRKHGTCSGLSQRDYFALTRRLFERITIPARYIRPTSHIFTSPAQMRHDFLATNLDLDDDELTIHCGNRRDRGNLSEIRICFDRDLGLRPCGVNERRQCRASQLVLPPVR